MLSQTSRKVGNNVLEKCEDKSISSIRIYVASPLLNLASSLVICDCEYRPLEPSIAVSKSLSLDVGVMLNSKFLSQVLLGLQCHRYAIPSVTTMSADILTRNEKKKTKENKKKSHFNGSIWSP